MNNALNVPPGAMSERVFIFGKLVTFVYFCSMNFPKTEINIPNIVAQPDNGWVYYLYQGEKIVYVGQTKSVHPMVRIGAHFGNKIFSHISARQVPLCDLDNVERSEIYLHRPIYNKTFALPDYVFQDWLFPKEARRLFLDTLSLSIDIRDINIDDDTLKRNMRRFVKKTKMINSTFYLQYKKSDVIEAANEYVNRFILDIELRNKEALLKMSDDKARVCKHRVVPQIKSVF